MISAVLLVIAAFDDVLGDGFLAKVGVPRHDFVHQVDPIQQL